MISNCTTFVLKSEWVMIYDCFGKDIRTTDTAVVGTTFIVLSDYAVVSRVQIRTYHLSDNERMRHNIHLPEHNFISNFDRFTENAEKAISTNILIRVSLFFLQIKKIIIR